MMRCRTLLLILMLIALTATCAVAFEWKTPVTDSVLIDDSFKFLYDRTAEDSDQHFYAAINRFNVQVVKGDMLAGMRYDIESYFEKEEYSIKYVPEKVYFQIDKRMWDLGLGDFYTNLGRGLTLSMLKNDQFGEDDTLQGGIANLKTTYVSARALGGFVNEGDSLEFKPERAKTGEPGYDKRDILYGGGVTTGHPSFVVIGGNAILGDLQVPEDAPFPDFEKEDTIQLYSASIEAPDFIYGNFYGEYAWLEFVDNKELIDDVEYEGRGAYAALLAFAGPVTLIAEGQDYYRFEFAHHEPPSLEYDKTAFSHAPRTDDIIGYRGRIDFLVPRIDTLVYAAYYNSQTHETLPENLADHYSGQEYMEWIEHAYGGIEKTFANAAYAFAGGGYREIPEGRWIHGEVDGAVPVAPRHQLGATAHLKQFAGFGTNQDIDYGSQQYTLDYSFSPWVTCTAGYEYSDEPAAAGVGPADDEEPHFYFGQVTVEPTQHVRVTAFYGREKGGLKCAGGLCRTVPPFEGAKMDLQLRF